MLQQAWSQQDFLNERQVPSTDFILYVIFSLLNFIRFFTWIILSLVNGICSTQITKLLQTSLWTYFEPFLLQDINRCQKARSPCHVFKSVWLVHCLCIVAMGTTVILYGFPSSNYLRRFLGYVDHTRLKFIICQGPLFLKSFFCVWSQVVIQEMWKKKMKTNAIARVIV